MSTITTRAGKGSRLSWTESDANFTNLNTDKLEINPALGTPVSGVLTNCTGTAAGLTAGTVTTNANLTGHVTSTGNAAVLGSFTLAQLNTAVSDANVAQLAANTFTGLQSWAAGADIASAATIDLTAATGNTPRVTGTVATSAVTINAGQVITCIAVGAWPLTYHATNHPLPGGVDYTCTAGDMVIYRKDNGGAIRVEIIPVNGRAVVDNGNVNEFRLTLTSGTPITTADVAAATTLYCCPYKGSRIALYDGAKWNVRKSAQFSIALGTLTAALPYDVFCYDNATVPTLEILAWTDAVTRATALVYQDGVLVKNGAPTRKYLGTFYTTSTTTTEDSATKRYLWNYYNRVSRKMLRKEGTASWTYTTAVWRQANAAAANQLNFVVGVAEDAIVAQIIGDASNSDTGAVFASVAVGLDSTTAMAADQISGGASLENGREKNLNAKYCGFPGIGQHYLAWLEYSAATGTTTWYGNGGGIRACGLYGELQG